MDEIHGSGDGDFPPRTDGNDDEVLADVSCAGGLLVDALRTRKKRTRTRGLCDKENQVERSETQAVRSRIRISNLCRREETDRNRELGVRWQRWTLNQCMHLGCRRTLS